MELPYHDSVSVASKMPDVEPSIFAKMGGLARAYDAINLSQGFPDFDCSFTLKKAAEEAMLQGYNQYAPMPGLPELTSVISDFVDKHYGLSTHAQKHITVTAGATQALFSSILSMVKEGDEVIIFEPAYDSYAPTIKLAGGVPIPYQLRPPNFSVDWSTFSNLISSKTSLVIVNTPHNPTGVLWTEADWDSLADILAETDIRIISDEVYEHITFDEEKHYSVLQHETLKNRSAAIFSFGKTFHCTGWKLGYVIAPEGLTTEIRKVHQFTTFAVNTPGQYAAAQYLQNDQSYRSVRRLYQYKKDLLEAYLEPSRLKPQQTRGTYFKLYDYSDISDLADVAFCEYLVKEHRVAAIPVSVFYTDSPGDRLIRLCFAKSDTTIKQACSILCTL